MCVDTERERKMMFSPSRPVTVVFFSPLSTSTSRFFSFWKRDFLLFLPPVRRRHNPKKTLQNKLKKGRSRHILLSVVSRSPGKLFKRTLTYCGKRTQRYVKREREREKKKRRIFSFVLPGVLAITRGEKWREEERNSQNKLRQPNKSSSSSSSKGKEGKNLCRPLSSSA